MAGRNTLSPVMSAWVAQSFYLHWRYTMDPVFLRSRAYPFTAQIGTALLALMRPGVDGKLELPLSTSPEIFDNSMKAWLPSRSTFDVALVRWLYGALAEMADAQGDTTAASHWKNVLAQLADLNTVNSVLTVAPGTPLPFFHRHLSNLMSIYSIWTRSYPFVPDYDAPGASAYRAQIGNLLRNYKIESHPHDQIISDIDEAGKTFHILVLKTNMTIPYSSVFIRLDCKYWSTDAERRLREKMSAAASR